MMVYIYLRHAVEDYDAWKPGFDAHASTRREYGSRENYFLFHAADDSNDVAMLGEWDTAENFQRFMEESDVKEKMGELGVVGEPEVTVFEALETMTPQPPAA
jgi:heme-degrading monooxygenase HmoA